MKIAKRKCKLNGEVQAKHPCFRKGRSDWEAECLVCRSGTFISFSCKGSADSKSHLGSVKHCKAVGDASVCTKVTNNFVTSGSKTEDKVTTAEGTSAFLTAKHHNSFLTMECMSSLPKKVFPDCDFAKKFSCARTKTEAVITSTLARYSQCWLKKF